MDQGLDRANLELRVGVLGPLELSMGGRPVAVQAGRLTNLVAVLAMSAGKPVSVDRLAAALWGEQLPANPRGTIQLYMNRLRRVLGADAVTTETAGYTLRIEPDAVDAVRFERLIADPARLDEALALWRGTPFAGLRSAWLEEVEAPRLVELWLTGVERRIERDLAAGRHREVVAELAELTATHPLREEFWRQLMVALHRCGRQAEALDAYQRLRQFLVDELGLEPSEPVQQLQRSLLAAPDAAPSPIATTAVPRQLPPDPLTLLGRSTELAQLTTLVQDHSATSTPCVIAISGSAGIGKTTFAIHAAHRIRAQYPDGQLYIDLHGYAARQPVEPAAALRTVLRSLGVAAEDIPADLDERSAMYRSLLADTRLLILLDNARNAEQVRPLLPAAGCLLIVTSRNLLRGLSVHDGAHRITLRALDRRAARGVLVKAIGEQRADGDPDALNTLTRVCGRIPLALRIAGERASRLPGSRWAELAAEMHDERRRLDQLTDVDDQASDLRATFSWSYRALTLEDARTFRLLGLHPAGAIGLPAAAALTGTPPDQARRSLDRLVTHNLLDEPQPGRFRQHDLLRLYAAELLARQEQQSVAAAATHRLLDWYLQTASVARDLIRPRGATDRGTVVTSSATAPLAFDSPAEALSWFDTERQVLPELVRRALERGFNRHAWQLAWALLAFYATRLHLEDGRATALGGLRAGPQLNDEGALMVSDTATGFKHLEAFEYERSRAAFASALETALRLDDKAGQAVSLSNLGLVAAATGNHRQAVDYYQRALEAEAAASQDPALYMSRLNLGAAQAALGNHREAIHYSQQAAAAYRRAGKVVHEAIAVSNVAQGHLSLGNFHQAKAYCAQALKLFPSLNVNIGKANALVVLGHAHGALGELEAASKTWAKAHALFRATPATKRVPVSQ